MSGALIWQQPATPSPQGERYLRDTSLDEVSPPNQVTFPGRGGIMDCFMTSDCAPGCLGPLHSWLVHIRKIPEARRVPWGETSEVLGLLMMCRGALQMFKPHFSYEFLIAGRRWGFSFYRSFCDSANPLQCARQTVRISEFQPEPVSGGGGRVQL